MIFQRFSQNKYKKRENRCYVTPKPLKGGRANGFGSSRSLNNRFCGLGRKNEFGPKLRETEMTFPFQELEASSCRSRPRRPAHTAFLLSFIRYIYGLNWSGPFKASDPPLSLFCLKIVWIFFFFLHEKTQHRDSKKKKRSIDFRLLTVLLQKQVQLSVFLSTSHS